MAEVPIPFTDQELDTDDGATSVAMTAVLVIIGFAAFAWFRDVGQYVASTANAQITDALGIDPTSGDDGLGVM